MPQHHTLCRSADRSLLRHSTRMLGGARRPPPPDYLAIACRALKQVIKIDKELRPFMDEQKRLLEDYLWHQEVEAAVRKVYGGYDAPCGVRLGINPEIGKETVKKR